MHFTNILVTLSDKTVAQYVNKIYLKISTTSELFYTPPTNYITPKQPINHVISIELYLLTFLPAYIAQIYTFNQIHI